MKSSLKTCVVCATFSLLANRGGSQAHAGLVMSVEAAGAQISTVAGVTTETFNSFGTGQYSSLQTAVGTLSTSGTLAIVAADIYGGAGGTGNYFAVGAQSGSADPVTLTFKGPESYFGLWWSAADANNSVTFYSGSSALMTYNDASAFSFTTPGDAYYGNPNNGGDTGEPFAYFNFNGTNGTTFTSVVFSNNDTTGTGFESDNFSVGAVPEPPSLVLAGSSLAICALVSWRRRRRARLASRSGIANHHREHVRASSR
jgi:hypothetical protein